jgi:deoxyinosine 3'endonuclease (endonuclease V)
VESNGNGQDEGGLTKKKVATGVAVGLATTAAAGVAKKLLENQDDETEQQDSGRGRARAGRQTQSGRARSTARTSRRSAATRSKGATKRSTTSGRRTTKSQTRRTTSSSRSSGTRRGANRTKEQLYNQAKRLGIEGRSSMNKAQLERAIQRARS